MKFRPKSISTHILVGFIFFTISIALLLWLFQIGMLNSFYKNIKYTEIKNTATNILNSTEEENFVEILQDITRTTGIDILVTNENGKKLVSVSAVYSVFFANLTADTCKGIYNQTTENGGEYSQWIAPDNSAINPSEELVYVKTTQGDSPLLIILNTRVTPVDSTVTTLKVQLFCVTIAMILLSLILAILVSRTISKPLANINKSAKEVANGNYKVTFVPKGSKEAQELALTLNYAVQELSKVEALRRELIANVSHDLRTPLTMISGYAEVMRDIPGENSPENVQVIIDEAQRLNSLVNDLLDLSKLEDGETKFNPTVVNLTKSIEDILTRYDTLIDYNFSFYHGEDIYVFADEVKISQVVYNLVNNAVNYTGEDKKVTLQQTVLDDNVKIEIIDTGEGIPQDKIGDIWDRYYKVDKSHKSAKVGTGIGLSIVKKVIELHKGTYGVISTQGEGSNFWFSLPINKNSEEI